MLSRYSEPESVTSTVPTPMMGGPTFALRYRALRLVWSACWLCLASWTPPAFQPWRRGLLTLFGARIHPTAMVRSSARVWWPGNLTMGARSMLAPGVQCYNVAPVTLGDGAIVSQRTYLCTASHDVDDPGFPLISSPIHIGRHAWIAAEAFVGPGVTVGDGAVLAARGVAARNLDALNIYAGNPARAKRARSKAALSFKTTVLP